MKINIIASSSAGNCIIIDDTMIDCGVSYKRVKDFLPNVKRVLISHEHKDHINEKTIARIHKEFPCIKFYSNIDVKAKYDLEYFKEYKTGMALKFGETRIDFVELYHNNLDSSYCTNHGYLMRCNGYTHFHATDTNTLEGIMLPKCDSMTLECNYNMEVVESKEMEWHIVRGIAGHLEDIKFYEFIDKYLKEDGVAYPCHMSERNLIKEDLKHKNLRRWYAN